MIQTSSANYAITDATVYTMDATNRVIPGGHVIVQNGTKSWHEVASIYLTLRIGKAS